MRTTFVRALAVTAILQFVMTRRVAGNVIEEGRAERLWMMYPVNVVANAMAWTLLFAGLGRAWRILRPAV